MYYRCGFEQRVDDFSVVVLVLVSSTETNHGRTDVAVFGHSRVVDGPLEHRRVIVGVSDDDDDVKVCRVSKCVVTQGVP